MTLFWVYSWCLRTLSASYCISFDSVCIRLATRSSSCGEVCVGTVWECAKLSHQCKNHEIRTFLMLRDSSKWSVPCCVPSDPQLVSTEKPRGKKRRLPWRTFILWQTSHCKPIAYMSVTICSLQYFICLRSYSTAVLAVTARLFLYLYIKSFT